MATYLTEHLRKYCWKYEGASMKSEDPMREMLALGTAIYLAQKLEFALYGIAAHLSHLPEAQADKRLKSLNGEQFLRGDPKQLKVTLGQLVEIFAGRLLLASSDLDGFVADRNMIVHNYYRAFHSTIRGVDLPRNPLDYLQDFIGRAQTLLTVVEGLIVMLKEGFAAKEGRSNEIRLTERDEENKQSYLRYVSEHSNLIAPV